MMDNIKDLDATSDEVLKTELNVQFADRPNALDQPMHCICAELDPETKGVVAAKYVASNVDELILILRRNYTKFLCNSKGIYLIK